jgi:excisionase family DNA binding protein
MPRPKTKPKPSHRADRPPKRPATRTVESARTPVQKNEWPEVLTVAEAAAYLRVPETEVERLVGLGGLRGRRIGTEWRFSRAAIQDWLRRPSMKEILLQQAGSWKDDPYLDDMLKEIYRRRGRAMIEEGS